MLNNYIDLFVNQATKCPHKQAIQFQDCTLTYQELLQKAQILAQNLRSHGVCSEQIIPLILERNTDIIISMLAVLMADCAFLPISPLTPHARIEFILKDTKASVIISNTNLDTMHLDEAITVIHPACDQGVQVSNSSSRPTNQLIGKNLAYVMYTSGSTGHPKGVLIEHQSMMNLFSSLITQLKVTEQDFILALTDYTFDISLIELLMPFLCGATVILTEQGTVADGLKIKLYLTCHTITLMQATPVTWHILLKEGWVNNGQMRLLVGGEQFKTNLAQQLNYNQHNIWNLYGPTETCMWSMIYHLNETLQTSSVPLGQPLSNTTIHVLNSDRTPTAIGAQGELYIGGKGLARGYLNNASLTQEKFIIHPQTKERLYKTGDEVIAYDAKTICYLGRADEQLKFGGIRVEAGEIESILEQNPLVKKAVIKVHETDGYYKSLAAYVEMNEALIFSNNTENYQSENADFVKNIYDEVYLHAEKYEQGIINNCGWQSSFTGQLFKAEELYESIQFIRKCIQSANLCNVLEIGCGTGSLLLEYIDNTQQCTVVEISSKAIDYVQKKLTPLQRQKILFKNESILDTDYQQQYSCVIINSVIQYLPSMHAMIKALTQLITATQAGGTIIIGDVRSLELMDLYLLEKMRSHAANIANCHLNLSSLYYKSKDTEIVLSPLFFHALKNTIPRISHVDISVKHGQYRNELNYFRYDVILHIEQPIIKQLPEKIAYQNQLTPEVLAATIQANPNHCICITDIPNRHLAEIIQEISHDFSKNSTYPLSLPAIHTQQPIDAKDCANIQALLNMQTQTHDIFVEYDETTPLTALQLSINPKQNNHLIRRLSTRTYQHHLSYGREPFNPWIQTVCFDNIKQHVRQHMIAWIMPSVYVWVEKWPLTSNGKLDKKKLMLPIHSVNLTPDSSILQQLQTVWRHVTGDEAQAHKDFQSHGTPSLSLYFFLATINQAFSVTINYHDFRGHHTLETLAVHIENLLKQKKTDGQCSK